MKKTIPLLVLILAALSLVIESLTEKSAAGTAAAVSVLIIYGLIILLSLTDIAVIVSKAKYKLLYIRRRAVSISFLVLFILLYASVIYTYRIDTPPLFSGIAWIIIVRNSFILFKVFSRFQDSSSYFRNMAVHPAQTVVFSFMLVIAAGTIFLSMPFSSASGSRLPLLDSLFTATSAVCVTGLIVVDTPEYFSFWGRFIIMLLIQTGGLGIMILSFSTVFMFRKKISMSNKLLISQMINEDDMRKISTVVKSIVGITFIAESIGAAVLFFAFKIENITPAEKVFYAVFHSVSAFCNAGFALFTDSLEQFASNPGVVLTVSLLIITGGISFAVIMDISGNIRKKIIAVITKKHSRISLSVNSRIVLLYSFFLVAAGTLIFYYLEHGSSMKESTVFDQYMSAFFQSVTTRTAGFNTIGISALSETALFIMIIFMFIGGAAGSCAGGIKVNNIALMFTYFRSLMFKRKEMVLYNRQVKIDNVLKAFVVLSLGVSLVITGVIILSMTENSPFLDILFETVSAFGTVGLSTGITSSLTSPGKLVIIFLMFFGRLGPLTIAASMSSVKTKSIHYHYPEADISIS